MGRGVEVGVDGLFRGPELDLVYGLAQAASRRCHERRVERSADWEPHGPFGAGLLGDPAGLVDVFGDSRDHDLTRGVVVGDPDVAGCAATGDVGLVVFETQQRGHGPGLLVGRGLHGVAAFVDEAYRVAEIEGA